MIAATGLCNLCTTREFELVKSELRDDKTRYKVYRCLSCGHVQLLPKPGEDEDREFYNKNLQDRSRAKEIDYEKMRLNNLYDSNRHVKLVREVAKDVNCRILDIGCGYGFFLNELHKEGYRNITGTELSTERRELALAHSPAAIIPFDVNKPDRDPGTFDLVTLFHVLEHMADPIGFLRNIRTLLAPGGIFVCEVPNVNELLLDACKEYNDFYWIRAHLNYFNAATLLDCMQKAGFDKVQIRFEQRYGLVNLCNWLTTGKPQIERPVFDIDDHYKPVESQYRLHLETIGRSDAVMAIARV